ncbi:MAG: hypothetical protein M4D80_13135 [Myxococcota bacterium]|nr:hypothetical protein [Myxococcota bacterium]
MRLGFALAGLCACNQVYGLEQTRLPPPDAPYACPEIGAPAPVFSRLIFQASTQQSASYHFNTTGTLAVASTYEGVYLGRFGETLTLSTEIVPQSGYYFDDPHPNPAGDRLYIQSNFEPTSASGAAGSGIAVYEQVSGAWRLQQNLPPTVAAKGRPSTVFRGPTGDRMIFNGALALEEYEQDGTAWVMRGPAHRRSELRIDLYVAMAITSDGLRAVFRGDDNTQMLYADRPNLESWFGPPQILVGVPKVGDAQLTDDCSRIYYSGLNATFYSQQQ